jgi:hypothetical protein
MVLLPEYLPRVGWQSQCPLPLRERATRWFNEEEWVRVWSKGRETPHPFEFADVAEMPSPTRGEGTNTATALADRSHEGASP